MHQLHRILAWVAVYFISGIIGGTIWMNHLYSSFCLLILGLLLLTCSIGYPTQNRKVFWLLVSFVLGFARFYTHPLISEASVWTQEKVHVQAQIVEKIEKEDKSTYRLKEVKIFNGNNIFSLSTQVKLLDYQKHGLKVGDEIIFTGKVMKEIPPMNPSDFSYTLYLHSMAISKQLQLEKVLEQNAHPQLVESFKNKIQHRIDKIFEGKDRGLIRCLLLGDKSFLEDDVSKAYQVTGISHLLALSGLHIGIIASILGFLLGLLGCHYKWRNRGIVLGIWAYCILVGGGASIERACIMTTLTLIIRNLWEEDDLLISLSIAALILVIMNPFVLYQISFQLSFGAMIGMMGGEWLLKKVKEVYKVSGNKLVILKLFLPTLCITYLLAPILAYHFYEVSYLGIALNVIAIPLFGIITPYILFIIAISFMSMPLASILSGSVIGLLEALYQLTHFLATQPYATIITGKPSFYRVLVYGFISVTIVIGVCRRKFIKYSIYSLGVILVIGIVESSLYKPVLEYNQLYVGQGDGAVIIMPTKEVIAIDTGPYQSGKGVERFLKYKGTRTLDWVIISHPHEDHVGGLLYLLENHVNIKRIITTVALEEDENGIKLIALCEKNKVPIYRIKGQKKLQIGQVSVSLLVPKNTDHSLDLNDESLSCLIEYKKFHMLMTGDLGIQGESGLVDKLSNVEVLKVGHHGSRTATSEKLLNTINPEYGIISCGINNRYQHPHLDILDRLESYQVHVERTDQQGAICIKTDGEKMAVVSQVQEE